MSEAPVLDTIAGITAASMANFAGSAEELLMLRLAALVAIDAPEASYLLHIGAATATTLTLADVENVLVALAPIVGTPRVVSAAGKIGSALDFAIAVALDDA